MSGEPATTRGATTVHSNGWEQGQVLPLVLGMAIVALAVAGLAVDGTRAFLFRRTLQNAVDAAALAGAGELDVGVLYRGGPVGLDPQAARRMAHTWLRQRGLPIVASVTADTEGIEVAARGKVSTTFLRLVGVTELSVGARARSEPEVGGTP